MTTVGYGDIIPETEVGESARLHEKQRERERERGSTVQVAVRSYTKRVGGNRDFDGYRWDGHGRFHIWYDRRQPGGVI